MLRNWCLSRGAWTPQGNIAFTTGLWLDQSDITTGFQDNSGATPQTASGQFTGLRLDKSKSLAFASELITVAADRDFSSDTGFWSKDAGVTIGGGAANWAAVAAVFQLFRGAFLTVGKYYEVTYSVTAYTQGGIKLGNGLAGTTRSAVGTYTERLVATTSVLAFASVGASTTLSIDNVSVKEVTGNHVTQSTASAKPEWDVISSVSSDFFDGSNDGYTTSTGLTFGSSMDLFITLKRASSGSMVLGLWNSTVTKYIAAVAAVATGAASAGVGSAHSYYVDGVLVGNNTTTDGVLHAAIPTGAYHVLEIRDLDLSAWTVLNLGLYTSFMLNADVAQVVLCPSQSAANRNSLRTYCGAKAGLVL